MIKRNSNLISKLLFMATWLSVFVAVVLSLGTVPAWFTSGSGLRISCLVHVGKLNLNVYQYVGDTDVLIGSSSKNMFDLSSAYINMYAGNTSYERLTGATAVGIDEYIHILATKTTSVDTAWTIKATNHIPVNEGSSYTLSFYVRTENAAAAQSLNGSADSGVKMTWDNGEVSTLTTASINSDGEWMRISLTATAPVGAKSVEPKIGQDSPNLYGTNAYIDIANIQFEEGSSATVYEKYDEVENSIDMTNGDAIRVVQPDTTYPLTLKLKNEDSGSNSLYVKYSIKFYICGKTDIEITPIITGMTAPSGSTSGFVKRGDGDYYYQNTSGVAQFFTSEANAVMMTSFNIPYSEFKTNNLSGGTIKMIVNVQGFDTPLFE